MKKHTKIYTEFFGIQVPEDAVCEICENPATDVHHIDARGMGGSNTKDDIKNLMGLCRPCHNKYGDIKHLKDWLREIHYRKVIARLQHLMR